MRANMWKFVAGGAAIALSAIGTIPQAQPLVVIMIGVLGAAWIIYTILGGRFAMMDDVGISLVNSLRKYCEDWTKTRDSAGYGAVAETWTNSKANITIKFVLGDDDRIVTECKMLRPLEQKFSRRVARIIWEEAQDSAKRKFLVSLPEDIRPSQKPEIPQAKKDMWEVL